MGYLDTEGLTRLWGKIKALVPEKSKSLANWYTSRPKSANVKYGDGRLRYFVATSAMTTGKPTLGDSCVLHLPWDNTGGWDAQIAIRSIAKTGMQIRAQSSGTWGEWKTVVLNDDLATSSVNGLMSAADKVKLDGIEAGATNGGAATTEAKTFTRNTSTTTAASVTAYKSGNTVHLNGYADIKKPIAAWSDIIIGTMPDDCVSANVNQDKAGFGYEETTQQLFRVGVQKNSRNIIVNAFNGYSSTSSTSIRVWFNLSYPTS